MLNVFFPRKSYHISDYVEKCGRARQATDDTILRCMRIACWITKGASTHPEYVILIAFPRQQWLRERTSMLRLFVHCLSCSTYKNAELIPMRFVISNLQYIYIYIYIYIFVNLILVSAGVICGPGSSVSIATELRAGRSGIESRWG
jgi:hypothetical protein